MRLGGEGLLSPSELVVVKWHMALQVQCQLLANPQVSVRQTWKEWSCSRGMGKEKRRILEVAGG